MALKRLDRILSEAGIASRSEIKEMIRRCRVTVNGALASASDIKADEDTAVICVDGKPIRSGSHYYIMLNKPAGCVSATEDKEEKTVLDLLPAEMKRAGVFPVGRLDKDTEGLLLLTDDGDWAHGITSPKKHVDKVYRAKVEGCPDESDVKALSHGMELKDGTKCLPADLKVVEAGNESLCLVIVTEGKYHLVRRMMAAVGHRVLYLERISIGTLYLDPDLPRGGWRELTDSETEYFK